MFWGVKVGERSCGQPGHRPEIHEHLSINNLVHTCVLRRHDVSDLHAGSDRWMVPAQWPTGMDGA